MLAAVGHDFRHVLLRPFGQLHYERNQRPARVGQRVFDFRRNLGIDLAVDESVGLEGLER